MVGSRMKLGREFQTVGWQLCCEKKTVIEHEVEGARPRGRPKKTWREIVEKDCQACKLNREDAMDRNR